MFGVKSGSAFSPLHIISVRASHRPTDHLEDAVSNLSKSLQNFNNLVYWCIYSLIPIVTWHLYSHLCDSHVNPLDDEDALPSPVVVVSSVGGKALQVTQVT